MAERHEALCHVKGCPAPNDPDWHIPWCGHGLDGHHQHWPKKSQGGTEIVSFICPKCHDQIDNGHWGNKVLDMPDGRRVYRVWDQNNKTIFERILGQWKHETSPVPSEDSLPDSARVQYTGTGLLIPEDFQFDEWQALGGTLNAMGKAIAWWIGDWLNFGERKYGEKYSQAIKESTGMEQTRLESYASVASRVKSTTRVVDLSWSHHREVASCPEVTQKRLLKRALGDDLTTAQLKRLVRHEGIRALTSSESNEWYTPEKYVEAVRHVLGEIDLDPASHPVANKIVKATTYFSLDEDGLKQKWARRIFLNPPYGDLVAPFVTKAVTEYEAGHISEAIILVNAHATDAAWFQPLCNYVLCFTDHRIDFYSSETLQPSTASTHGSVFAYLGPNEDKFIEAFWRFGRVFKVCDADYRQE